MVYFTGDIHGDAFDVLSASRELQMTKKDTVVLLGDVGANYYGNEYDDINVKQILSEVVPTVLCIHGNHEMRPETVSGYKLREWNGGNVWSQEEYPNLLFAKDGEIYTIEGLRYIVIGGAYSVDKYYRRLRGLRWFSDEQPDDETKARVEEQLRKNSIDIILSHTCPFKYIPREMFISGVNQSLVDDSTERWLDKIEETTPYKAWFCGHWHTDKHIDKMHFLFHKYESSEQFLALQINKNMV